MPGAKLPNNEEIVYPRLVYNSLFAYGQYRHTPNTFEYIWRNARAYKVWVMERRAPYGDLFDLQNYLFYRFLGGPALEYRDSGVLMSPTREQMATDPRVV